MMNDSWRTHLEKRILLALILLKLNVARPQPAKMVVIVGYKS
jgi:hypothetical protein